mmetsp:Transcript_118333/g.339602  ORF Transcript_118333/g.339602 Transcript_118333/m.339602 type:complete len:252 (-) Transcript_118333:59-814(-)
MWSWMCCAPEPGEMELLEGKVPEEEVCSVLPALTKELGVPGGASQQEKPCGGIFAQLDWREDMIKPSRDDGTRVSDASTTSQQTFTVELTRPDVGAPWGATFDSSAGGMIHIAAVSLSGPVTEYNKTAPDDCCVLQDDCVVDIDGHGDAQEMINLLRERTSVTLRVSRPHIFRQTVQKAGGSLGLALRHAVGGSALFVGEVIWGGATCANAADVATGDLIVAVNGRRGSAEDLLSAIRACDAPVLTIARVA